MCAPRGNRTHDRYVGAGCAREFLAFARNYPERAKWTLEQVLMEMIKDRHLGPAVLSFVRAIADEVAAKVGSPIPNK